LTEWLDVDDVLQIHRDVHCADCLRDVGLLYAAVARPQATAFGDDAYPDAWEKAAALLHSLASNHPFTDGNKRTAWRSAWTFLELNGHPLSGAYDVEASKAFMVSIRNSMTVTNIAETLKGFG